MSHSNNPRTGEKQSTPFRVMHSTFEASADQASHKAYQRLTRDAVSQHKVFNLHEATPATIPDKTLKSSVITMSRCDQN